MVGKGDKARVIPIYPQIEVLIDRYLASRAERFPDHDLEHPATPLFVAATGVVMTPRAVQYLIERLYVRAGIRTQVPAGALVHALRHTFATAALAGGTNVLEVQQPGCPGRALSTPTASSSPAIVSLCPRPAHVRLGRGRPARFCSASCRVAEHPFLNQ